MKTKTKAIILQILAFPAFMSIFTISMMCITTYFNHESFLQHVDCRMIPIFGLFGMAFIWFAMLFGLLVFRHASQLDNLNELEKEYVTSRLKYEGKLKELETGFLNNRKTTKIIPRKKSYKLKEFIVMDYPELVKESSHFMGISSSQITSATTNNFISMLNNFAASRDMEFVNIISTAPLMVMFVKHSNAPQS